MKNAKIVTLGEIATSIFSGNEITEPQIGSGTYPAIKNKDISNFSISFSECKSFVNPELIKNPKYVEKGDLIMSNMGALKIVGKTSAYLGNQKCLAGNHVIILKHNQNSLYLSFSLSSSFCRKQIKNLAQKSTVCDLYVPAIKKIKIPLPSLEEQAKIVKILDLFYELCQSVKTGIPALIKSNKQQYEFIRDKIFEIQESQLSLNDRKPDK